MGRLWRAFWRSGCLKLPRWPQHDRGGKGIRLRTFFRVALCTILLGTSCLAQTGIVTFYSPGISFKGEASVMFPRSRQPFDGRLFDGTQELAQFRHGRFATFHFNPGIHSFTLRGPEGADTGPLLINVEDGGHYCVRLYARMTNLGVYSREENQIEVVPCQQAQREAEHLRAIEPKRVSPTVRGDLDPATSFPRDSSAQR